MDVVAALIAANASACSKPCLKGGVSGPEKHSPNLTYPNRLAAAALAGEPGPAVHARRASAAAGACGRRAHLRQGGLAAHPPVRQQVRALGQALSRLTALRAA